MKELYNHGFINCLDSYKTPKEIKNEIVVEDDEAAFQLYPDIDWGMYLYTLNDYA